MEKKQNKLFTEDVKKTLNKEMKNTQPKKTKDSTEISDLKKILKDKINKKV